MTDPKEEENEFKIQGYSTALLRTLKTGAGVKFLRFQVLDVANNPRMKSLPLSLLVSQQQDSKKKVSSLEKATVQFARVVVAGLPSYGDLLVPESGLDAGGTLLVDPDFSTLRILPYAPTHATVLGNLRELSTGNISDLCTRSLLKSVLKQAKEKLNMGFKVGAELEFTLFRGDKPVPVDVAHFAYTRSLNDHQEFLAELHDQLVEQQDIAIELLHKESGPGQLELVLKYCEDPITLADHVVLARETIANLARQKRYNLKAVFLPKIYNTSAGSGCHLHLSMYNLQTGLDLFPNHHNETTTTTTTTTAAAAEISPIGQYFMEGILSHLPALLALTLPTTNSFRRVGPGCWTGSSVSWAYDDKESPLRVVLAPGETDVAVPNHFEYKLCDHSANLYLALAGILACGMEGIQKQSPLRPQRSVVDDTKFPRSVTESLDALEKDEFLIGCIPNALLKAFLAIRRTEAERASKMTLEQEVEEAWNLA